MNKKNYTPYDIHALYHKHVPKTKEYFTKYNKVPLHLQDNKWKWDGHDYARIPCLLDFREWILKYNIKSNKLLYTSNEDPEILYLEYKQKYLAEYNIETHTNDLHTLNLPDKDFDFILFSQTLEHLFDPVQAMTSLLTHLVPGGYIFTSVPIINIAHMTPIHFGSMTQIGLITLFDRFNLEILEVGQWGNKQYLNYIFEKQWWPDYRNLIDRHGVIPNEPINACSTWILAKK